MWGIVILNIVLLMITLGVLLVVLKLRPAIHQSDQQVDTLIQELELKLPLAAAQLKDGNNKLMALRELIAAVLIQLPQIPRYFGQAKGIVKKIRKK